MSADLSLPRCNLRDVRDAEQRGQLLTSQWPPVCLGPHVPRRATGVGSPDSCVPCQAAARTTSWLDMMIFVSIR